MIKSTSVKANQDPTKVSTDSSPPKLEKQPPVLCARSQAPPARPGITSQPSVSHLVAKEAGTDDAHSPAYSDISDANEAAPTLEKESGAGPSLPEQTSAPSGPGAFTGAYYSQPPSLTPAVTVTPALKDPKLALPPRQPPTGVPAPDKGPRMELQKASANGPNAEGQSQTVPASLKVSQPVPGERKSTPVVQGPTEAAKVVASPPVRPQATITSVPPALVQGCTVTTVYYKYSVIWYPHTNICS